MSFDKSRRSSSESLASAGSSVDAMPPHYPLGVHILVDNNNLFHGAQLMEDGSTDRSIRVSIKEFAGIVRAVAEVSDSPQPWRLVAGQMRSDKIAAEWRRYLHDHKP